MSTDWREWADKLYCALELSRRAVGVTLLNDVSEYEAADAKPLLRSINYCQMVAAATKGKHIKARSEDFSCRSGPRVMGIDPSDPKNAHGENWARLKLYDSEKVAADVRKGLTYSKEPKYGLFLAPIEDMDKRPDVVLIVANPYNCMRIIQGYAYHHGMPASINMIGNQAVCLECTARPYVTRDINISLLCIGTRHRAGWGNDEMAVGVPQEQFADVVDGIVQTINQMESDANKEMIKKKFRDKNIPISIRFHYNYYMDC